MIDRMDAATTVSQIGYMNTRYKYLSLITDADDRVRVETFERPDFTAITDWLYYEVSIGEQYRPDLVAFKYYRNPKMYWVILAANDLTDPFDFVPGLLVKIPTVATLSLLRLL